MLKTAIRHAHPAKRELRWLAEDFIFYLPFLGAFMNRIGAVRACQENAERLLKQERLVGVFPEGVKGIGKLFRDRYKLQRFGRGGFIRLCLRTRTPIVPCAVIGAEEANPMLYRLEYLAKRHRRPVPADHSHLPCPRAARSGARADQMAHRIRRADSVRRLRARSRRRFAAGRAASPKRCAPPSRGCSIAVCRSGRAYGSVSGRPVSGSDAVL